MEMSHFDARLALQQGCGVLPLRSDYSVNTYFYTWGYAFFTTYKTLFFKHKHESRAKDRQTTTFTVTHRLYDINTAMSEMEGGRTIFLHLATDKRLFTQKHNWIPSSFESWKCKAMKEKLNWQACFIWHCTHTWLNQNRSTPEKLFHFEKCWDQKGEKLTLYD